MLLTRKQRAVLRLAQGGFGTTDISRMTGMHRVSIHQLLARAKKRLRKAGFSPEKLLADDAEKYDLLELVA